MQRPAFFNRLPFLSQKPGKAPADAPADLRPAHLRKVALLYGADTGGEREGEYFLRWLKAKRRLETEKPRYLSGQTVEGCAFLNAGIEHRIAVWDELILEFDEAAKAEAELQKQVVVEKG